MIGIEYILSERRHEFALLDAIGIPNAVRKKIVFSELRSLVGWGVGVGLCAATVSIIPSMSHLGVASPVFNLSLLILAILLNAALPDTTRLRVVIGTAKVTWYLHWLPRQCS